MGCNYNTKHHEDEIESHHNYSNANEKKNVKNGINNNNNNVSVHFNVQGSNSEYVPEQNKTNFDIPPKADFNNDNQQIQNNDNYNNNENNNNNEYEQNNNNNNANEENMFQIEENDMNDNNDNNNNSILAEPKDEYSKSMLQQINQLRNNPSLFIPDIETGINYITREVSKKDGKEKLIYKNKVKVALNEGEIAFRNAMADLENREGMPPLQFKEEICIPLPSTIEELNDKTYLKREWSKLCQTQEVSTCWRELVKDPTVSFLLMVVDDSGKKALMKRNDILNPDYKYIGISSTMIEKHFIAFFSFAK